MPASRAGVLSRAWSFVAEPSAHILDQGSRREARLLTVALLVMIGVFASVDTALSLSDPRYQAPWYGYLFLAGSYGLARTRHFKVAAVVAVAMFPVVTFVALLSGGTRDPVSALGYLVLSPALASIFLPIRGVVAFGLINVAGIVAAPMLAPRVVPPLSKLVGPLSASVIAVALAAVYMRHRNQLEQDRRAELESKEARLRLALDSAHMGIGDWSRSDDCALVSPQFETIFGLDAGASGGSRSTLLSQIDAEDRDAVAREINEALNSDRTNVEMTFRVRWRDQSVRWVLAKGRLSRNEHGTVTRVTGVVVDFTERRRLEDQLRQAQKMEVVGRLAGGVAHDFNNILTVILGNVDLLLRTQPSPQLREISNAALSAGSLTRQLLGMSRQAVFRPRVIDLNEALRTGVSMLRRVIGADIETPFFPDPNVWPIKADEGQIQQIVLNLATNARDAMPHGGTLTISTSNRTLTSRPPAVHGTFAPGDYAVITMVDTGTGMEPSMQVRIFEPFFTTKEAGRGTGLGLPMVLGIISQSGGFLVLESDAGRGSSFAVYFPRAAAPPPAVAVPELRPTRGTETVLLVEDEARIRSLCAATLTGAGYCVLEAGSSGEALELWQSNENKVQLLLSDVVMPGMSGRELAERLLGRVPALSVIFMSGYAPGSDTAEAPPPKVGFLQKPFTPEQLLEKVRAVLDSSGSPEPGGTPTKE